MKRETNIFEKATREKFRFEYKGMITVEDLWDLVVTELDEIYKGLNSQKKQQSEDSLLETKTVEDTVLGMKIDIIKYIVETKQEENNKRQLAAERKEKKEKIMEIIARKQDSELEEKSIEELNETLNSL